MALTGRRVAADEAFRLGLVHRVVPADEHLDVAARSPRELAAFGAARARPRQVVHDARSTSCPLERATAFAQSVRGSFMTTPDFAEGLAAFAEKRPPRFVADGRPARGD